MAVPDISDLGPELAQLWIAGILKQSLILTAKHLLELGRPAQTPHELVEGYEARYHPPEALKGELLHLATVLVESDAYKLWFHFHTDPPTHQACMEIVAQGCRALGMEIPSLKFPSQESA